MRHGYLLVGLLAMVDGLIMNVYAVHLCNREEYLTSLREMMPRLLTDPIRSDKLWPLGPTFMGHAL